MIKLIGKAILALLASYMVVVAWCLTPNIADWSDTWRSAWLISFLITLNGHIK